MRPISPSFDELIIPLVLLIPPLLYFGHCCLKVSSLPLNCKVHKYTRKQGLIQFSFLLRTIIMTAHQSAFNPPIPETVDTSLDALGIHRGAIDQTMITTQPPSKVMTRVSAVLHAMGVEIQEESTFKYRCIRAKKDQTVEGADAPPSQGLPNVRIPYIVSISTSSLIDLLSRMYCTVLPLTTPQMKCASQLN